MQQRKAAGSFQVRGRSPRSPSPCLLAQVSPICLGHIVTRSTLALAMVFVVMTASSHANDRFIAFMNSRVGTWKHSGEQTGPEKFKWSTTEVFTRQGSGSSTRWKSTQRIVFADGVRRRDVMTIELMKGGGWTTKGTYGEAWYYPNGKMRQKTQLGDGRGRWLLKSRKSLKQSFTISGYTQESVTTFLGSTRWRIVGKASDGTRTVIVARKIR